ncbi:hypothetical protein GWI33_022769 [Rhynchophorus ferrugineus]|uniref:Uncharacterized protein n=1 Tax=Rhynchophorus ferrugineus TaxID=354439 RepID=A0A834IS41_RHYFE|nr:hypothetical protein GWI33_022769 [Rhynchophorus ferrugineus]
MFFADRPLAFQLSCSQPVIFAVLELADAIHVVSAVKRAAKKVPPRQRERGNNLCADRHYTFRESLSLQRWAYVVRTVRARPGTVRTIVDLFTRRQPVHTQLN